MIEVVCLNPAMDRTLLIPNFAAGSIHRSEKLVAVAGGKGLNTARFVKSIDPLLAVSVTGFVGGCTGQYIVDHCAASGIHETFVRIEEATRVCVIVVEHGRTTVINEDGPTVRAREVEQFRQSLAGSPDLALICGSAPPGVPSSLYYEMVQSYKERGVPIYVDTSGSPLKHALDAVPTIIKVNEMEFANARQVKEPCDEQELIFHADRLLAQGSQAVIITRGKEGSLVITKDDVAKLSAPPVPAVNTIACGDAYFAGLAVGMSKGLPIVASAILGAAAAALKVGNFAPMLENSEQLAAYQQQVVVAHRKRGA